MDIDITIRKLSQIHDLLQVSDLQKNIGGENPEGLVSLHSLVGYTRNGGYVLGAFADGLLVGYLVSYLGTDVRDPNRPAMANLKLVVEGLAVLPDYRSVGLGTRLMMFLRDIALKQGVRLITLPFDPLDSRCAYLFVRKLGMMVGKFIPNYFGDSGIGVQFADRSDQVVAEWWITGNRVEERLFGKRQNLTFQQYLDAGTPLLNPTELSESQVVPYDENIMVSDSAMLLVEIPFDFSAIVLSHPSLANVWRKHVEDILGTVMLEGYVATDFLIEQDERRRSFYLLSYDGPGFAVDSGR